MTTISMHAGNSAIFGNRPASRGIAARRLDASHRAARSPAMTPYFRNAFGAAGRFALALLPFSFLAWMFVAN